MGERFRHRRDCSRVEIGYLKTSRDTVRLSPGARLRVGSTRDGKKFKEKKHYAHCRLAQERSRMTKRAAAASVEAVHT
ncbi:hypothetical protein NDU88_002940 [Pleurodeles waltl]|uniref:Uncharacterized protein n=1 Tax=Pleurodeles waltl TaxID=8319 RepID=A0AAV7QBG7_PLEWA|nr:hypothetical protein NDU88_002940 [Pleurodeles waltl]